MEAAQTAIARAQALLDPTGQGLFSAQRLMPYLNIAYSSLRDEGLAQRDITATEAVTVVPGVPAYTRDLSAYVAPNGALANLAAPIAIWEKPAGSGDDNYTEMHRVDELEPRSPEELNRGFEWRGGNVCFTGATQALDLQVRYEQIWPALQTPASALGAIGIATILGYWTAGLMAVAMREEALGGQYIAEARHLLFGWVQRQVMDSQAVVRRPRPFRDPGGGAVLW